MTIQLDSLSPAVPAGTQEPAGSKAGAIVMQPAAPRAGATSFEQRWGVVLAGGEGVRLRRLTQTLCGDSRPKQFCPLVDGKTLLDQTLRRAELADIPPAQVLISLNGQHSKWYWQESRLPASQRIVQPANKGTAPALTHALLSIGQIDPDAVVAVFPADHHYSVEHLFLEALNSAFAGAAAHPRSVLVLGARPRYPETQYGWIELGSRVSEEHDLFKVRGFWEKPNLQTALELLSRDSVWNTFVMVGQVSAFLEMMNATVPDLVTVLRRSRLWRGEEAFIEFSVYERLSPVDFSRQVLEAEEERLLILRLGDVGWTDLGDPKWAMQIKGVGKEQAARIA